MLPDDLVLLVESVLDIVGARALEKGLGLHSASRLTYDLGGDAVRFKAQVAVDDAAEFSRNVVLRAGAGKAVLAIDTGQLGPGETFEVDLRTGAVRAHDRTAHRPQFYP